MEILILMMVFGFGLFSVFTVPVRTSVEDLSDKQEYMQYVGRFHSMI